MATVNHSFIKGMNRDISKDKFPNDSYYYLSNGRVMTNDEGSTSDITNILGNTNANINENSLSRVNYTIIGYNTLLDDIILFYAQNSAIGVDSFTTYAIIDRLVYNGNDSYTRNQLWNGQGLNFRIDKPIRSVARYESEDVQKVYWVDNNNPLKYINIGEDISLNTSNMFDNIGDINITPPKFIRYSTGELKVGSIAYAYRYVKQNGQATLFSTASNTIPLGRNIQNGQFFPKYKGDDIYDPNTSYSSGIGVATGIYMQHNAYKRYDYVDIVSLWYSSESAVPDVTICGRITLPDTTLTGSIYVDFTDTGKNSYGTLTYDEFVDQSIEFTGKDIITKDNRLFVGNITETTFDLDKDATWTGKQVGDKWDARAYRFDSAARCELLNMEDVASWITSGTITSPEYVLTGPSPSYVSVNEIADAINPFNRVTSDENEEENSLGRKQKYQVNGSTIGGSGINITYSFSSDIEKMINISSYIGTVPPFQGLSLAGNIDNEYQLGIHRGFQRDEVYRFGIVFFDKKGRQSFVKWIGDIRIPSINDNITGGSGLSYLASGTQYNAKNLIPFFSINNNPQINGENLDFKIVYVERTKDDRGVLMSGLLLPTKIYVSSTRRSAIRPYTIGEYTANVGTAEGKIDANLFNFSSPELLYARDDAYFDIDFMQIAGEYIGAGHTSDSAFSEVSQRYGTPIDNTDDPTAGNSQLVTRKFLGCVASNAISRSNVTDYIKSTPVSVDATEYAINGIRYKHSSFLSSGSTMIGRHGTSFTLYLSDGVGTETANNNFYYAYARRNIFESQYGGLSYGARQQNSYIDAGGLYNPASPKGDIYIHAFEYGNHFGDVDEAGEWASPDSDHVYSEYVANTVETTMNLNTKLDTSFFREIYYTNINKAKFIRETDIYVTSLGVSWGPMYNYNNAYNKLSDTRAYYPKPQFFNQIDEFSTRVRYSDVGIDNTDIDSLLKFRANNYNDANKKYGPINRLIEFQDRIFNFQDNSVSIISINPRVTQQSEDGVTIILGSGSTIDNFQYLTTDIGCQDNSDIIKSLSALYWLDKNKKKIYTFGNGMGSISDVKGMYSYLRNNITENSTFVGVYDSKNSEIIMTIADDNPNTDFVANNMGTYWLLQGDPSIIEIPFIVGRVYKIGNGYFIYQSKTTSTYRFVYSHGTNLTHGNTYDLSNYITEKDNFTISFSEKMQAFQSFYSFIPSLYIYHNKGFFSSPNNNTLYQHDIDGNYYNTFYGNTYPTTIKFISNSGGQQQVEYTNIGFFCEVKNGLGELQANESISNISLRDATQLSEDIILYPIHLVTDADTSRYVLDTSAMRIGTDWYTGLTSNNEDLVIYENELYRCLTNGQAGPPSIGVNWRKAELSNIRKTINKWYTQMPRCEFDEFGNYTQSNRFRSDWLEITLEFKDLMPGININERRIRLSDVNLIGNPLFF